MRHRVAGLRVREVVVAVVALAPRTPDVGGRAAGGHWLAAAVVVVKALEAADRVPAGRAGDAVAAAAPGGGEAVVGVEVPQRRVQAAVAVAPGREVGGDVLPLWIAWFTFGEKVSVWLLCEHTWRLLLTHPPSEPPDAARPGVVGGGDDVAPGEP